jgi:hypothetical protein
MAQEYAMKMDIDGLLWSMLLARNDLIAAHGSRTAHARCTANRFLPRLIT